MEWKWENCFTMEMGLIICTYGISKYLIRSLSLYSIFIMLVKKNSLEGKIHIKIINLYSWIIYSLLLFTHFSDTDGEKKTYRHIITTPRIYSLKLEECKIRTHMHTHLKDWFYSSKMEPKCGWEDWGWKK